MKPRLRDYLMILISFLTVLLCGYGIGHLVGQQRAHRALESAAPVPAWQRDSLRAIEAKLDLRPEQIPLVEAQLAAAAQGIQRSQQNVMLEYLLHIHALYDRLAGVLDPSQAGILKEEKRSLEVEIELRYPNDEDKTPH